MSVRWSLFSAARSLQVAVIALLVGCGREAPTEPGRSEYRILFEKWQKPDPYGQLATVDPEGGPITVIVPDAGIYYDFQSTADGRQVLFTRDHLGPAPHGVHALRVSGLEVRALPNVGPGYMWSPDATRIASLNLIPHPWEPGDPPPPPPLKQLRITDASGAVLVDFPVNNSDYSRPSWSPDGRELIYTHDIRFDGVNPEVFVASVDATVITNVSNSPEYEGDVAWSPTGTRVALFAVRGGDFGIFTMRPDGTELTLRYRKTQVVGYRWSPDGSMVLFLEFGPKDFEGRLMVMRADGSAPTIVAQGDLQGLSPTWSPDGQWIAFSMLGPSDEYDVYVVRPNGSSLRNLTESAGHGRSPVWIRRE
jgi:hypothetical protein